MSEIPATRPQKKTARIKAVITGNSLLQSKPQGERSQIQVIARAASVLRALEDEDEGLSLGQIAGRVGLPRSTIQRIVAALDAEKFVVSASSSGGWRLGPALTRLASSVKIGVLPIARPLIMELSSELNETVDISIPKKDCVVFIDQVVGSQRLRTVSAVGEAFPLYCTANGKAVLAALTDEEVTRRIGKLYGARTSKSLTTFEKLSADLLKIRKQGYAVDREEHTEGVCAAGVLVHDALGNPLLISVPVPASRFEDSQKVIVEKLLKMKSKLQERFGGGY
jgi:DNA-binding IclR family transcriptional regulator